MIFRLLRYFLTTAVVLASSTGWAMDFGSGSQWQKNFDMKSCDLQTTGINQYFILEPGHQLVLEGGDTKVQITVLDETKTVDGVVTRVVEERGWEEGKLHEVARNYFAICEKTKDVFYFGEDVDFYKDGKVDNHEGSWLAGVNGNKAGLAMPGNPKVDMKYYQEVAPGLALDRAEIVSLTETCKTPAGTFSNCMKVEESSGLKLKVLEKEFKYYAPEIGLVGDGEELKLTTHSKK